MRSIERRLAAAAVGRELHLVLQQLRGGGDCGQAHGAAQALAQVQHIVLWICIRMVQYSILQRCGSTFTHVRQICFAYYFFLVDFEKIFSTDLKSA